MTLKQMVEMVQQHHPKVGETGITETSTFNTVSGTKYYSINAPSGLTSNGDVVTYNKVSYDGEEIQFIRNPEHIEGY